MPGFNPQAVVGKVHSGNVVVTLLSEEAKTHCVFFGETGPIPYIQEACDAPNDNYAIFTNGYRVEGGVRIKHMSEILSA